MQYLSVFVILLYVFACVGCLVFCGIESALLIFAVVMLSSHNIITFLCYCNVDCFIPEVVVLRYDYKPTLNTIITKLSMVGTCKPESTYS